MYHLSIEENMQYSEIEKYLENHPLQEKFTSFSEKERCCCIRLAERDILTAIYPVRPRNSSEDEMFLAAVAEQTLFLLLNPEVITGSNTGISAVSSGSESRKFGPDGAPLLGQRAAAIVENFTGNTAVKIVRG